MSLPGLDDNAGEPVPTILPNEPLTQAILPPWASLAVPMAGFAIAVLLGALLAWGLWVRSDASRTDERLVDAVVIAALVMVMWTALVASIASLALVLGLTIEWWILAVAAAATGLVVALVERQSDPRASTTVWIGGLLGACLVLVSVGLSGSFYDISSDGQAYHAEAVLQIAGGWNPVRSPHGAQGATGWYPVSNSVWMEHYPHASWYVGTAVLDATNRIETSKTAGFVVLLASGLLSFAALERVRFRPRVLVLPAAVILSCSPIAVAQITTNYVDGLHASLMLIVVAAGVLAVVSRRHWWLALACIASALAFMCGIKFTATANAVLLTLAAVPVLWLSAPDRRAAKISVAASALALIIGVGVVGLSPYLDNLTAHGSPFYPVTGAGRIDVMEGQIDGGFLAKPWVVKLASSLLSESGQGAPVLKIPGTVRLSELMMLVGTDARVGGFGPLFGAALLASLAAAALLVLPVVTLSRRWRLAVAWVTLLSVFSVMLNSAAWWARLAPQEWLMAITVLLALAVVAGPASSSRWRSVSLGVAWFGLAMVAVNGLIVLSLAGYTQVRSTEQVARQLRALRREGAVILVDPGGLHTGPRRLAEAGVAYRTVTLPQSQRTLLTGSLLWIPKQ